jgi:RHS repeat-associated protein
VKIAAGPPVVTTSFDPITGQTTTNILQQAVTNFYDSAGAAVTNVNALGERTITTSDALGRVTRVEIRNGANQIVRETDTAYTFDHHGKLVSEGSGSSAVETYHYTDNEGHDALDIVFSSANRMEYNLRYYDMGGLIQNEFHMTDDNGSFVSDWARNFGHDALGRLTVRVDRDDAYTYFYPDAMGNITNRVMPGGLQWRATYNNAGQMTKEWNVGGTSGTRTNTYNYFSSGSPFAGLLQTRTDNRGVTSTITYDSWLRPATNSQSGSLAEQNLTTAWQYDARGLATNVTEQFASSSTGPSTAVQRRFDAYGQITSESVVVGGATISLASQGFDAAGRRTALGLGNGYTFGWRPDGLLASVSLNQFGSASYSYTTGGLLTNRTVGGRSTTVSSRDGAGRPLSITATVNTVTKLTESLTWTGDGLLSTHTMNRAGDFTDSREYFYGTLNRRLTEERLNLDSSRRWTNLYTFDNGAGSGPGVLTRIGQTATSSTWSGVKDAFSRVGTETNTYARQTAYGKLNGLAHVSLSLDNVPVSFSIVGTTNRLWPYQWRATLELQSGTHRLDAKAVHDSGLFTTNATSWFTNNIGALSVTNIHDGNGNLTQRIWRKANGTTNLIQTLAWDGRGRLFKVTERDSTQTGRDFTVTYDALGRRLRTTEVSVTNNVALTNSPLVVDHYFDPLVEFLELGLNEGGKTTWKLMGPDLDGRYGGQNGTGGFEATASGMTLTPLVADAFGTVVATINGGSVSWSSSRSSAYGAVPGYKAPSIGIGNVELEYAWRNRAADSIGLTWMGGNWLDPVAGRFISFDPLGHDASDSGYNFCNGNPVGYSWDPDGRLGKGFNQGWNSGASPYGSSGSFDAGYWLGGVLNGGAEGFQGGASITANTLTFGGTDAVGWTESGQYQGADYTGSRILATVGRESLITAATFGTAQLARGGSEAALYGYQGLQVFNTARSGYQVGTGIDQVSQGNNWGWLNIAGGTLGVAGTTTLAAGNPGLNSLGGVGPSSGGFAQAAVNWWNAGSAGDAAFQNLSFMDKVRSEVGMKSLTDAQFTPIQGLNAVDRGGQLMGNGIGGTLRGIFDINPRQIFNLLGTGPSPGARLGIPPAAFISSGTVNVLNSVTMAGGHP